MLLALLSTPYFVCEPSFVNLVGYGLNSFDPFLIRIVLVHRLLTQAMAKVRKKLASEITEI